jgi:putative membrane protein insertion efficiency factor
MNVMKYVFLGLIRLYQLTISPMLGECCRFHPHCSEYAMQVMKKHGCGKGVWLIVKRIVKCHPWHPGGNDPVP